MSTLNLALIAALCVSASFAMNVCPQRSVVNMPFNNSAPYYFPSTWNENQTAPQLKSHQSCSWTVTIPQGYYVKLIIDAKVNDKDSKFQIIDSVGNFVQTQKENKEPWYFPSPKITITAQTEALVNFGFKLVWAPLPVNAPGKIYGIGDMAELFNATNTVYANTFSADTVSLLTFPADPSNIFSYRSAIVFDGIDRPTSYKTNLYFAAQSNDQLLSSSMYVINVEASPASMDQYLVQDYARLKDFAQYSKLYCFVNIPCQAALDGGSQQSALVSVQLGNQTITDIQMDDDAVLTVYYGAIDGFGFDSSYNSTEIKAALPKTFLGGVTEYVLSKGSAKFTFNFSPPN